LQLSKERKKEKGEESKKREREESVHSRVTPCTLD